MKVFHVRFVMVALLVGSLASAVAAATSSNAKFAKAAKKASSTERVSPVAASGPNVLSFVSKSLEIREGTAAIVQVRLQKPAAADVYGSVEFAPQRLKVPVVRVGIDADLPNPRFVIRAGKLTASVEIIARKDDAIEPDEIADLVLRVDADQKVPASPASLEVRIIDTNRKMLIDVRSAGAVGDGVIDDTKAIQAAVNKAASSGAGVVLLPAGIYLVSSVQLYPGVTVSGYGAVVVRPASQGKWTRTFTTENDLYSADHDSSPLVVEGITFDGSAQSQGPFRGYELEQAHLMFFNAAPSRTGRLVVRVIDCEVRNAVADGVSVYDNVDMTVRNLSAADVFRGAIVLTGGNSKLDVDGLRTTGETTSTGIDIEVDGRGNGTRKVEVNIRNVELDGTFQAAVYDGSTVSISGLAAKRSGLDITNENSSMMIKDSTFVVGAADDFSNRIIYPGQLIFDNVEFQISKVGTKDKAPFFGLDIWWKFPGGLDSKAKQKLDFVNSRFIGQPSLGESDVSIGVFNRYKNEAEDSLTVEGTTFTGLTKTVA